MSSDVRKRLIETLADMERNSPDNVTIVELAKKSGVGRSVIYRDHHEIADMVRRHMTPSKMEELEILRLKVNRFKEELDREKQRSDDLATVCSTLLFNLKREKERSERLEGRLKRMGSIR